jgi:cell division protein YceG involved in septum cleavage
MKKSTIAIIVSMITILFIGCMVVQAKSSDSSVEPRTKLYKSIEIQPGDTLWSISENYMTEEYSSIHDYIREVKEINGFNGNTIYEGCYLIIPYYAD